MKQVFSFLVLSSSVACVAAADDVQSICAALNAGLTEQLGILKGMTDTTSSAAAVPALQANFDKLQGLNGRVDTTAMWRHIENTPELKSELVLTIQLISIEFCRIEEAQFYGCEELRALLAPLLIPAAARPDEQPEA
ncbi:MAG: hypothetical protein IJY53_05690 [Akkermansia sp.]|nr:hypothetical protein [Akkermansia sp.]